MFPAGKERQAEKKKTERNRIFILFLIR